MRRRISPTTFATYRPPPYSVLGFRPPLEEDAQKGRRLTQPPRAKHEVSASAPYESLELAQAEDTGSAVRLGVISLPEAMLELTTHGPEIFRFDHNEGRLVKTNGVAFFIPENDKERLMRTVRSALQPKSAMRVFIITSTIDETYVDRVGSTLKFEMTFLDAKNAAHIVLIGGEETYEALKKINAGTPLRFVPAARTQLRHVCSEDKFSNPQVTSRFIGGGFVVEIMTRFVYGSYHTTISTNPRTALHGKVVGIAEERADARRYHTKIVDKVKGDGFQSLCKIAGINMGPSDVSVPI